MKSKIIIWGTSQYSLFLYQTLKRENCDEVVAFTLHKKFITSKEIESLPVIPFEDIDDYVDMNECKIALTIGYKKLNDNRKKIYDECKMKGYKLFTYISKNAMCYSDDIGEGAIILPGSYIGPYVKVGIACCIHIDVWLSHNITVGDFTYIAGGTMIGGTCIIGKNCFIGMSCTLKNGIHVGDRTFLGADSYLADNTLAGKAYVGSPAQNPNNIRSEMMMAFVE